MDDLFTPMLGHPELHSDNVHFNDQGVALQAAQVAIQIEKLLEIRNKPRWRFILPFIIKIRIPYKILLASLRC